MAFVIQARMGRGRTIETFAGRLEVGGESLEVAVKRPRPELAQNEAFLAGLVEWGNKQKAIEVDDVVAVLEAGRTTADGAYVIQERVIGASLAHVLEAIRKRKRTITLPMALGIAEKIAGALAHLHERNLVHGGLDPSEVLISYAGEVKVGDQELHTLDVHATADLAPRGASVLYRAPELAPDKAKPTFSSDAYALALILLEMLIGHAIWTAPKMTVETSVTALKDFTHLGQAQSELTQELVEILALCTAKNPVDRVPSGKELAAGLKRVISKHHIAIGDASLLGTFVKALIPRPRDDDAPTEVQDPARLEKMSKEAESISILEIDSGSVPIDPELERKAFGIPAAKTGDRNPSATGLVSQAATPTQTGSSISKVVAAAAQASDETARRTQWQLYAGFAIVGLIVVLMIVHMATRGASVRIVQVSAASTPPSADLFLDDQPVGKTPVETSFAVSHGKLHLRFELSGYARYEAVVEAREDRVRYEAVLKPLGP